MFVVGGRPFVFRGGPTTAAGRLWVFVLCVQYWRIRTLQLPVQPGFDALVSPSGGGIPPSPLPFTPVVGALVRCFTKRFLLPTHLMPFGCCADE